MADHSFWEPMQNRTVEVLIQKAGKKPFPFLNNLLTCQGVFNLLFNTAVPLVHRHSRNKYRILTMDSTNELVCTDGDM